MKSHFRVFVISILVALVLPATSNAQPTAGDSLKHAYLTITSEEDGLPVYVDNQSIGVTPVKYHAVAAGKHTVAVSRSRSGSWLDPDWVQELELAAGDTVSLQAQFVRGYVINSTPFGAEVWLNGKRLGTTPYILRLREGTSANIEISMEGYRPAYVEVGLDSSDSFDPKRDRKYDVVLQKDLEYVQQISTADLASREKKSRYRRYALIAAGVSAVSGVAAVLLKREADDSFEQYLVTGNPERRDELFDRTERYDTLSGIAFGVLEVSFAVSLFTFLKSAL